ncbi:hypothetical protein B0T19DRAFT_241549 [Cercophora scortea]|uniref:Uncharacterized protein n=1 Tax=Cercophora scortea TaxID=314031 RepID=A0AAE0I8Z8_9PEZI|nr:hypothetical protein B0T19DRAFT_241549 [Cercophora scortea]
MLSTLRKRVSYGRTASGTISAPMWPYDNSNQDWFNRASENKPYLLLANQGEQQVDGADSGSVCRDGATDDAQEESEDDGGDDEVEDIAEEDITIDPVRLFMRKQGGEEHKMQQALRENTVAGFCVRGSPPVSGGLGPTIAVIDDRSRDHGTAGKDTDNPGRSRPYLGPLSAEQLFAALNEPRFYGITSPDPETASEVGADGETDSGADGDTDSGTDRGEPAGHRHRNYLGDFSRLCSGALGSFGPVLRLRRPPSPVPEPASHTNCPNEVDAERRIVFMPNLDASGIKVLAKTASITQLEALSSLFIRHLQPEPSISVTIPARGFTTFKLAVHLPHYVLREHPVLRQDRRPNADGSGPLRRSYELRCLTPADPDKRMCLYEVQTSIVVTGIGDSVWAAYGVADTYFEPGYKESSDSLDHYTPKKKRLVHDPIAGTNTIWLNKPIWSPREYLLTVFDIRLKGVERECSLVCATLKNAVSQRTRNQQHPNNPVPNSKRRQNIMDSYEWNEEMLLILTTHIYYVGSMLTQWEMFNQGDIGYFHQDSDSPSYFLPAAATSDGMSRLLQSIRKNYEQLQSHLRTFEELRRRVEGNRKLVATQLGVENYHTAVYSATLNKILIIITILCIPPALASSLFNMQGVLPFAPSLSYFGCVLLILFLLVLAVGIAMYYLDALVHGGEALLLSVRANAIPAMAALLNRVIALYSQHGLLGRGRLPVDREALDAADDNMNDNDNDIIAEEEEEEEPTSSTTTTAMNGPVRIEGSSSSPPGWAPQSDGPSSSELGIFRRLTFPRRTRTGDLESGIPLQVLG